MAGKLFCMCWTSEEIRAWQIPQGIYMTTTYTWTQKIICLKKQLEKNAQKTNHKVTHSTTSPSLSETVFFLHINIHMMFFFIARTTIVCIFFPPQRSSRKKICILMIVLAVVAVVIGLIIWGAVGKWRLLPPCLSTSVISLDREWSIFPPLTPLSLRLQTHSLWKKTSAGSFFFV